MTKAAHIMEKLADIYYARLEKKRFLRKPKALAHVISDDKDKFVRGLSSLKKKHKGSRLSKFEGGHQIIRLKTKGKKHDREMLVKLINSKRKAKKG